MDRAAQLAFADQLRRAREAALNDAEAFDGIIHSIERLGSFLTQSIGALGKYKETLTRVAAASALAEDVPKRFRGLLMPFSQLFEVVRLARNDALHQGAFARANGGRAIRALI